MNLCCEKHQEVCYDGHICPVCVAMDERDDALVGLESAEKKISVLEERISDMLQNMRPGS